MASLLLGNYARVLSSRYADKVPVNVYRSRRTGLHVAMTHAPGPTVSCNIVFATETETDDGLPHTLEHLTFMGSKSCNYKGALDLMALKAMCLRGGTNAYTERDHTCYDVSTVQDAGMQRFLPIYADHLLNPLLTPENYATEVYHVTAAGEEAGVVYCEIQQYEHDTDNMVTRRLCELAFPTLPSYYASYGGQMAEVRNLCSLERVRAFHSKHYHLRNMWILLCGTFDECEMLTQIDKIDSLKENAPPATFERPFSNANVPNITNSRHESAVVNVPAEHEDECAVTIGFLGRHARDIEWSQAIGVLETYLADSTSAPLQQEMVLIAEPYCEDVSISTTDLPRCLISVEFTGVPIDKTTQVADKFFEVLRRSTTADALDMDRIKYIIQQEQRKVYLDLEGDVSETIFGHIIGYQLFSASHSDQAQFDREINRLPLLNELLAKPAEYWAALVKETYTDNSVVVIGKPHPPAAEAYAKEEKIRLEKLKSNSSVVTKAFDAVKLVAKKLKLDLAGAKCDATACPQMSLFDDVTIDEKKGRFNVTTTVLTPPVNRADSQEQVAGGDISASQHELLDGLPFTTIVHSVDSQFIRAYFLFDMRSIPMSLRVYHTLFMELLFASPAVVEGQMLSDTQVADLVTKELTARECGLGLMGSHLHFFAFHLEMPANEFHLLPKWSSALLAETVFEASKILPLVKGLVTGASEKKRDGYAMSALLMAHMNHVKEHEGSFADDLILQNFHRDIINRLERGETEAQVVVDELNMLRRAILSASCNLHLICDPLKLEASSSAIGTWDFLDTSKLGRVVAEKMTATSVSDIEPYQVWTPARRVLKVDGCEASYIICRSKVVVSYACPEQVAVRLAAEYLSITEGPLWIEVRGPGLAYTPVLSYSVDHDCLTLLLLSCARPIEAYETTKNVVLNMLKKGQIDPVKFDLARKSAVANIIARYSTLKSTSSAAAYDSFTNIARVDIEKLIRQLWTARVEDVIKLASPYLRALFDPSQHLQATVCPRNKFSQVQKAFKAEAISLPELQYALA